MGITLRVRQRQKPVLVQKFTCKNKNGIFVKEIITSGYIVAWAIYILLKNFSITKFLPKFISTSIPNMNFKFDTALEDSNQYLTQQ